MPIVRSNSDDVIFAQQRIELAGQPTPQEIRDFTQELHEMITRGNSFERELTEAERDARKVLADHPGMGTDTGTVRSDAPPIVEEAVMFLHRLPGFRDLLEAPEVGDAGAKGFQLGALITKMRARQFEKLARRGLSVVAGAQKGGKRRAQLSASNDGRLAAAEQQIAECRARSPGLSRSAIAKRIAPSLHMTPDGLLQALRRRKKK